VRAKIPIVESSADFLQLNRHRTPHDPYGLSFCFRPPPGRR
jgi:hypothetical protein